MYHHVWIFPKYYSLLTSPDPLNFLRRKCANSDTVQKLSIFFISPTNFNQIKIHSR